ncbi:MAG: type II toxin-antitoxin system HicA family toxin [Patescibacteria group bacterium]
MPKIPAIKPRELIKQLKRMGFVKDHQTGSHVVMYHPKTQRRAVIAYHSKIIKKGTLNSLLKEAGVSRNEIS